MVYSHAHSDHIGAAADILNGVGGNVTIYATKEVKDEIKSHHMEMPAITNVISNEIDFEGIKIEVDSRLNGHTEDNTLFIINDGNRRILTAIDLIHPDQLEFKLFSLAHDPIKFQTDLEILLAHKWDVMVTGHGNLAYKADVYFLQTIACSTGASARPSMIDPAIIMPAEISCCSTSQAPAASITDCR